MLDARKATGKIEAWELQLNDIEIGSKIGAGR